MKKNFRLGLLVVAAAAFIAVTFTGCPDVLKSFGKDDLFGTWMTLEFADGEPLTYYGASDEYLRSVTWKFDGKAENMFNGNGGSFWQHLVKYAKNADGTPNYNSIAAETVWYGEYAIKGNSSYSKGKLYLYYECGYDVKNGSKTADEVMEWKVEDYLEEAGLEGLDDGTLTSITAVSTANGTSSYVHNNVTIQVREVDGKKQCGDIEYFRFNLKDGSASGYTRLMATALDKNGSTTIGGVYNQWATENENGQSGKFDGGWKTNNMPSWQAQTTRYMGRISVTSTPAEPIWLYSNTSTNADLFNLVDSLDSTNYADPDEDIRAEE